MVLNLTNFVKISELWNGTNDRALSEERTDGQSKEIFCNRLTKSKVDSIIFNPIL